MARGTMAPAPPGRSGGMADAAVSNTAEGNLVWVRLPSSAPDLAVYWLVIRNTSASVAAGIGSTAAGTYVLTNTGQTKTLGSALGSTLDFVAATWTKNTGYIAAALNGWVFG